jgi:hypothetical protein
MPGAHTPGALMPGAHTPGALMPGAHPDHNLLRQFKAHFSLEMDSSQFVVCVTGTDGCRTFSLHACIKLRASSRTIVELSRGIPYSIRLRYQICLYTITRS